MKMGIERIEVIMRTRCTLLAGFMVRMEDTRLPKCQMFGESAGRTGCVGYQHKEWTACLLDLRAFSINAEH